MFSQKLHPGDDFPQLVALTGDDQPLELADPSRETPWRLIVVYRGRHCPLCTKYLNQVETYRERLLELGVDIIAVSGDSKEQLAEHSSRLEVNFPLGYGLNIAQMQHLGLYVSHPRSEQETDHPFAEPGLFVVNQDGNLHVVDISNNPFVRPELEALVNGIAWIKNPDNHYPIRGTFR
ncbi:redoxin domain-containing protein [Paraferrimonas haliotis]|uniref:Thioredoxin peroxidase n=1 Tax=Paraferrimonas haliotis TaxID=2013866 RepID=A0AA37TP51_9GAMM|nr:redoxin domain-containing protein [Paraferrimonas haliotis]GLS82096.1 thioredoxin peroxidase [Paraferrimonas haliotis]